METSLGRLQKQVDSQEKRIVRLQDCLEHQKEEKNKIKTEYKNYKKSTEKRIEKELTEKFEAELAKKRKTYF